MNWEDIFVVTWSKNNNNSPSMTKYMIEMYPGISKSVLILNFEFSTFDFEFLTFNYIFMFLL